MQPLPVWSGATLAAAAPPYPPLPASSVRRILTLHLNNLGDLLFTLPALAALRAAFPGARITSVVRPPLAPLLLGSGLADEILLRPRRGRGPLAHAVLARHVRNVHADLAVAFSQSLPITLLAGASGAPLRVGFDAARLGRSLLTRRVPRLPGPFTIEAHLDLVCSVTGGLLPPNAPRDYHGLLRVAPENLRTADRLLGEGGIGPNAPFVIAAREAGGRRAIKEWPGEHWQALLDELAVPARPVVLVGASASGAQGSDDGGAIVDLRGRTDLPTLAALCQRARLFLGSDSGALHLAAAVGTPVVGIFGPTDWRRTAPRGVPTRVLHIPGDALACTPCLRSRCRWADTPALARRCLTDISPSAVLQAARELLDA